MREGEGEKEKGERERERGKERFLLRHTKERPQEHTVRRWPGHTEGSHQSLVMLTLILDF